jgi:FRG domain
MNAEDLENRTTLIVRCADWQAAISIAKAWEQDGRADWFRGQTYPWPPRSSLWRWRQRAAKGETLTTEPALFRFYEWAKRNPEMASVSGEEAKLTAIAQHFGLPTDFVDFSLSPEIAGLFSRDRSSESTYPSEEACIYCLNLTEAEKQLHALTKEEAVALQVWPEIVLLTALHRLMAQQGVFFHGSGTWDEWIKPACIIFPRGPTLSAEERQLLYPPTSKLEEDLVAFFQADSTYEWAEYAEKRRPGSVIRMRPPPEEESLALFRVRSLVPAADWLSLSAGWASAVDRPGGQTFTIRYPPQTQVMAKDMFAAGCRLQLEQMLQQRPEFLRTALRFELAPTPGLLAPSDAIGIGDSLNRAWNAMEPLPFSTEDRLQTFEHVLFYGSLGLGSWNEQIHQKLEHWLKPSDHLDRWVDLELGAVNGAWSTGLIRLQALLEALRKELDQTLSDEGRELLRADPLKFLLKVRKPSLIFDFRQLVKCFVEYLIPTQVLLRVPDLPVVFSPASLTYLGPH